MDPSSPILDTTVFYIQESGAMLFGLIFLFLYRQSRVVYFGLWGAAWFLRFLAAVFAAFFAGRDDRAAVDAFFFAVFFLAMSVCSRVFRQPL